MEELEATLSKLTSDYQHAIDEKVRCQREADATSKTIALANRLVNGLASEKVRWSDSVQKLREQGKMLPGDVLIVASFISYLGCFTKQYREVGPIELGLENAVEHFTGESKKVKIMFTDMKYAWTLVCDAAPSKTFISALYSGIRIT